VPQVKNAVAAADPLIRLLGVLGWLVLGVAACGQAPAPPAATSRLINTPPIAMLTPDQLHGLATRCGRYPPQGPARGPYDAAYCEAAIAAWSDSPIQMLRLSDQRAVPR
jgi:hypothetical protein